MKKKILIPTDFSANANNAIKYALELYKGESCEIFLLHSYYHSGFSSSNLLSPEPTDKKLKEVKENALKNIEKLKVNLGFNNDTIDHTYRFLNEFGPLIDVIIDLVKKEDIKLIIMGTRGETDDSSRILGNNAVNVIEKIRNCPVLAIPGNITFKKPNEIVFPTSLKTHFKESELKILIEISKLTMAPIRILHILKEKLLSKEQLQNKTLLHQILDSTDCTYHEIFNINLHDSVRCFVQSRESEMVVFINKKHSFFGSVFSNPMVEDLSYNINVPILALHDLNH